MISQKTARDVLESGVAINLRVVQGDGGDWYFAFDVPAPNSSEVQEFTLKTERGQRRTWADPRRLFGYLDSVFGIKSGSFQLHEAK